MTKVMITAEEIGTRIQVHQRSDNVGHIVVRSSNSIVYVWDSNHSINLWCENNSAIIRLIGGDPRCTDPTGQENCVSVRDAAKLKSRQWEEDYGMGQTRKEWEMSKFQEFKYRLHNALGQFMILSVLFSMVICNQVRPLSDWRKLDRVWIK
jgi:hypothetical protein